MDAVPSLWPSPAPGTLTSHALLAQASRERMTSVGCRHPATHLEFIYLRESSDGKGKKVKFSHTRYRALGPELIPVYRQSARR